MKDLILIREQQKLFKERSPALSEGFSCVFSAAASVVSPFSSAHIVSG